MRLLEYFIHGDCHIMLFRTKRPRRLQAQQVWIYETGTSSSSSTHHHRIGPTLIDLVAGTLNRQQAERIHTPRASDDIGWVWALVQRVLCRPSQYFVPPASTLSVASHALLHYGLDAIYLVDRCRSGKIPMF